MIDTLLVLRGMNTSGVPLALQLLREKYWGPMLFSGSVEGALLSALVSSDESGHWGPLCYARRAAQLSALKCRRGFCDAADPGDSLGVLE